jgi:hypothetical protein
MFSDACALPEAERDVSLIARLCRSGDNLAARIEEPTWSKARRVATLGRGITVALPEIRKAYRFFRDGYSVIPVVLCRAMWDRKRGRRSPLETSLVTACIYDRLETSENDGTRERPTTESSSTWARLCTSGYAIIDHR